MRELKFRCWNAFAGVMEDFESMKKHGDFYRLLNRKDYPIMQYTGLKDKNGVEIYESDMVSIIDDVDCNDSFTVEFCDDGRWIINSVNTLDYYDIVDYDLVVIGNIHQNPELLESEK